MAVFGNKLEFLLIMPRLVQTVGDGYVFPLGMAYISSSLKHAGFNVHTLNLNHTKGKVSTVIEEAIKQHNINIVGTGGLSPQYHLVKHVIEVVKKLDSDILTVVGGGLISADPNVAMEALEYADYGVIGEGEATVVEFAQCLEDVTDIFAVDGLIIKDGDTFTKTATRDDIEDIDTIPWPDYEGFQLDKYLATPPSSFGGLSATQMVPMLGSRSCPYSCTFCFHSIGHKYRRRSLDDFFGELDYLVENFNIEYISMADELFAPKYEDAKAFSERMGPYGIPWHADFAINIVKPGLLPIMKKGGLDVMFFGLESADDAILKSMRKGLTMAKTERVLKEVMDQGISSYGCFIFGDVEETAESAAKTMKWWHDHPEYLVHLTLIKPFPGSAVYRNACENGLIKDKVQYLKDGCPQINISKMTDQELALLAREISDSTEAAGQLEAVELHSLDDRMGRETISATCPTCGGDCTWEDVKLFAIDYISCDHCQQKFHIPLPPQLRENLDRNVSSLVKQYGKIAIWGMTISAMDLFKNDSIFAGPDVYPIDISESKRTMDFYGKNICAPSILEDNNVPVVIIAVPSHITQISYQILENHRGVTKILDICELVGFDESRIAAE
ncbi:MAG: radical SAM protein [Alphaproteobacteria bacterium]|jgi:anaerobic magnesium-protoporphyrin IX monomethyl ester cyclase|nr:radical SAM protein [Alphaproteobacteria bacterium]MBT4019152.1 radical SAM protein [Alphaproteobacteria bacterium]MBT5159010.1 radical SAM protein [Alphaproteobacteria bacterium]MBT7747639.1 radical SAM protein [Alphaproteobacteria bacterium]